jgi:NADPH2:quinone reductase
MHMTIQSVATTSTGEADHLVVIQRPQPAAQPGETVLTLTQIGVNFLDVYQARGRLPVAPGTVLGYEGVGTASDGKRYAVITHQGMYAQQVAVPDAKLIAVPDDISDEATMLLFQGITAHYLTATTHPLRAGETVLVYAAAGGVGSILMQLAKAAGARPIGVVSHEAKALPLRERGFEVVVGDGSDTNLVRTVASGGVDVAFDANGIDTWDLTLASMRARGHVVLFGMASGDIPPFAPTVLRDRGSLSLSFPSLFEHAAEPSELRARAQAVFDWLRAGIVAPLPFHRFALTQARDAHLFLESRRSTGKIVLEP